MLEEAGPRYGVPPAFFCSCCCTLGDCCTKPSSANITLMIWQLSNLKPRWFKNSRMAGNKPS